MITIYHLGVSQSDRIVWLMEELGLPYQLEWFDRAESGLAPLEYKALHPVATAPVIRDGDLVLCESQAIVEYIINRHGNGRFGVDKDQPNYPDLSVLDELSRQPLGQPDVAHVPGQCFPR